MTAQQHSRFETLDAPCESWVSGVIYSGFETWFAGGPGIGRLGQTYSNKDSALATISLELNKLQILKDFLGNLISLSSEKIVELSKQEEGGRDPIPLFDVMPPQTQDNGIKIWRLRYRVLVIEDTRRVDRDRFLRSIFLNRADALNEAALISNPPRTHVR